MSDQDDQLNPQSSDLPPEEDNQNLDAEALANEVAAGADDEALADEWAQAMAEAGETPEDDFDAEAEALALDALEDESIGSGFKGGETGPELDVILDIPVRISMEVGSTQIPIRNLLQLNQGSVVELDRLAGEPLDVMVNGTLIAHGEVVMVNDKFGIRLTDVVSQSERIQRLR